jgi:hypothetical protein
MEIYHEDRGNGSQNQVKAQEKQIEAQAKRLATLEDIEAIKRLQKAYGYYVEHMMHQEIISPTMRH